MSRTYKDSPKAGGPGRGRRRNISVRAVRRDPPDLRKLSRALIQLAMAEAAAETAAAEHESAPQSDPPAPDVQADHPAQHSEVDHD